MNQSFQDQENKTSSGVDEEVNLKEVIYKLQKWWGIIWLKRLKIVSLSIMVGLIAILTNHFLIKPTYRASYQLFFQNESGGLSSALRLASSFGLAGFGSGSESSSITVQEYITSRDNIAHALTVDLEKGRLIDRYYDERIKNDEEFAYNYRTNFGRNQRYTDSMITKLFIDFNLNNLSANIDKKTGAINFEVSASNEIFVYDLATVLVNFTEEQFKNWKKEKNINAVQVFQNKVDSLEVDIDNILLQLGQYEDQNNSLVSSVEKMKRMRLALDRESRKVAYGEYIKGLEMSKVELMNLEPPFKYFDQPTYPLSKEKVSTVFVGVLGSLVTGILLVLFFIGQTEFKNIMTHDDNGY